MNDDIEVETGNDHPFIKNAGLIGDIANERFKKIWIEQNNPQFPTVDQMFLNILIEDYNQRHSDKADKE